MRYVERPVRIASFALACSAALWAPPPAADACAPPQPTAARVAAVDPPADGIPADGALIVRRTHVPASNATKDGTLELRTKAGAKIAVTVELLGSDLERWRLAGDLDRDVELVDDAGKVVQVIRQRRGAAAKLAPPRIKALTSTTSRKAAVPKGIAGATVRIVLAAALPANARYVALDLAGAMPVAVFPVAAGQVDFSFVTHSRKSCSPGPPSVLIGDRVALSWIDDHGRRSPLVERVAAP